MNESSARHCFCCEISLSCDFVVESHIRVILLCDIAFVQYYVHKLTLKASPRLLCLRIVKVAPVN
jgi:hypothetical protein